MSQLSFTKGAPGIQDFLGQFKSKKDIVNFLLPYIFPNGKVVCPYCGASDVVRARRCNTQGYYCWHCHKCIAVFAGTMFENSKSPLERWLYIIHTMFVSRNSKSTAQIIRETDTSDIVYIIRSKIQMAMANYDLEPFSGIIQMDECYLGGSNHGRFGSAFKIDAEGNKQKATYPVFGTYEQETGRVYSYPAIQNAKGQYLSKAQIKEFVDCTCEPGSIIVSDEWPAYNVLEGTYVHQKVRHKNGVYVNEDGFTTNGIEAYWSTIKKMYYGSHHVLLKDYIHLYLAECDFRRNYNTWPEALDNVLKQCVFVPRVIDIRQLGRFGNKTYDLHDYRMILSPQFDNIPLEKITVDDILNSKEPIYGILRTPYLTCLQRRMGVKHYNNKYGAYGYTKGGTGYKDHRATVKNDKAYIAEMLKDATKHKDVNCVTRLNNAPKTELSNSRVRNNLLKRKLRALPTPIRQQLRVEFPGIYNVSNKTTLRKIYNRMHYILREYDKFQTNISWCTR